MKHSAFLHTGLTACWGCDLFDSSERELKGKVRKQGCVNVNVGARGCGRPYQALHDGGIEMDGDAQSM